MNEFQLDYFMFFDEFPPMCETISLENMSEYNKMLMKAINEKKPLTFEDIEFLIPDDNDTELNFDPDIEDKDYDTN